ncbi:MAG: hypothetical protein MZV65_31865 [Chromatiales bacterium]|nr:hypothetical protein [Chromatiales bacterium]
MSHSTEEKILILAKTYPSPSAQYIETSCVAGVSVDGNMRRLFPVPFRFLDGDQQFKKWQWIQARIEKSKKDHRPESHKLYIDTISCKEVVDTKKGWSKRREWLDKLPSFSHFDAIDAACEDGKSLALLRPKHLIRMDITKAKNQDWTKEEKEKLIRDQMQGCLFSEEEAKRQISNLRKLPFDFYYVYACETPGGEKEYRHKIVDWEAGSLFWNCFSNHGKSWEEPFRTKLEDQFKNKDLMFLMGNQHRFQDQWMIISLIYPPKRKPAEIAQGSLF